MNAVGVLLFFFICCFFKIIIMHIQVAHKSSPTVSELEKKDQIETILIINLKQMYISRLLN